MANNTICLWYDKDAEAPSCLCTNRTRFPAAITDDGVPVAVGHLLIIGGDLKREGFVVLECGTAIQAHPGDAGDREIDCQNIAHLAGWVVAGCKVDPTYRAVAKRVFDAMMGMKKIDVAAIKAARPG